MLLGEQSFGCQRCQQPADEKIDLPPDTAKPLAEERIAMNGEEDQRFADTLAKRAGVLPLLSVDGGECALVLRKLQGRVCLGQDDFGGKQKIVQVLLCHGGLDREESVDL